MSLESTYRQLREELEFQEPSTSEALNEVRVLRGATALVFATNAKKAGDNVVRYAQEGKSKLSKINKNSSDAERLEAIISAQASMFDALIENRKQIGNAVGISLASVLVSERSNKQLVKLLNKRR